MELLAANQSDIYRRIDMFHDLVTEDKPIETWDDFQRWVKPLEKRAFFRGLSKYEHRLETTIERAALFEWQSKDKTSSGRDRESELSHECQVLKRFQSGAHHYLPSIPSDDEVIDWLAIMQHHGAPTRMMDFTRSVYVALYFAMEREPKKDCSLWAIDRDWLEARSMEMLRSYDEPLKTNDLEEQRRYFNRVLLTKSTERPTIIEAKSKRLNQRMMAQQGVHLCRIGMQVNFTTTLMCMLVYPKPVRKPVVRRIRIMKTRRPQFLENLQRMNITAATLFPGLDGFARSLGFDIDIWKGDAAAEAEAQHQKFVKERGKFIKALGRDKAMRWMEEVPPTK